MLFKHPHASSFCEHMTPTNSLGVVLCVVGLVLINQK